MSGLANSKVYATLGVKDMEEAKQFYGETLGLNLVEENYGGVMYESGGANLFVYQSDFAGTNQATGASWMVNDIESLVEDMKAKGVTFERYDTMPGEWRGDVCVMEGMKAAWFKDPSGNILNLGEAS